MPKRPQEHQLETESRVAFEQALGSRFVFRRMDPDYGVDGEVEEFDSTGDEATGLRFFVQLKATAARQPTKALKVSIPLDTANYYRSLALPVLMVRYHAPAHALFTRWFHRFDPYYGGVGKNSLTFTWDETDIWDKERGDALVADVRAFLALRSPSLPLPLPLHVETPASGALGLTATEIAFAVRAAAALRPDMIELRRGTAPPGALRLRLSNETVVADLAGVTTATLHFSPDYSAGALGKGVAVDAMVMMALAFEHIGQSDLAARLAASCLGVSGMAGEPEVAWALSSAMARARRVSDALRLSEQLDLRGDPDSRDASLVFTLPALFHGASLTDDEVRLFRETLRARIARRLDAGDRVQAGREFLNLGNHFRNRAEPREAVSLYVKAARYDPAYRSRTHFWHELGGALFGSHHYAFAADAYARALDLGADQFVQALRADAVMHAGRYAEARELFSAFNASVNAGAGEWQLKEVLLTAIVDGLQINQQQRHADGASEIAGSAASMKDPAEVMETLERARRADALCALAWFNFGRAHLDLGQDEEAFIDYLAAGLLGENDPEAWVNAIALAFRFGHFDLLPDILATAYRFSQNRLMQQLVEFTRAQGDDFPREPFLAAVDATLAALPEERDRGFTLRVLGDDGSVKAIQVATRSPMADPHI